MSLRQHAKPIFSGTSAEKSALSLTTDGRGIVWYDTDEDRAYIWSGAAWVEVTKISELYESDGGGPAWSTDATGNLANVDGETLTLNDDTPTGRIVVDPGTSGTDADITIYDFAGTTQLELSSSASYRILFSDNSIDKDITMIQVDVSGDPVKGWDEASDSFTQNKGLIITSGNLIIPDDLIHSGDADTLISFTTDDIEFQAGGVTLLQLTETTQDVVSIGDVAGTGDVDVNFNNGQLFLEGSTGYLGIGISTPNFPLHFHESTGGAMSVQLTNADTGTTTGDGFIFGMNASEEVRFLNQENTQMTFSTNNTVRLYIKADGNIGLNDAAQFGSGVKVIGIGRCSTNPSTNPAQSIVLYVDSATDALKARGSSGTTTTIASAEPHCPVCGSDFALEWQNDEVGHLIVCMNCLTKELGDRPYIIREETHNA